MSGFLGWLARNILTYLLFVAAGVALVFAMPRAKTAWQDRDTHVAAQHGLEQTIRALDAERNRLQQQLQAEAERAAEQSLAELDQSIAATRGALQAATARRRSDGQRKLSLLRLDLAALLEDRRLELEIQYLTEKLGGLQAARARVGAARQAGDASALFARRDRQAASLGVRLGQARLACARAAARHDDWKRQLLVRATGGLYDRKRGRQLEQARTDQCARQKRLQQDHDLALQLRRQAHAAQAQAAAQLRDAQVWTVARLADVGADLQTRAEQERVAAGQSLQARAGRYWQNATLRQILKWALAVWLFVKLSPYLIRIACYFVLAPLAERRGAIRLRVPGGRVPVLPTASASAPSAAILLQPGEELLVRQDHLQTSSRTASKRTKWLLDWSFPLTSWLTGLRFLTRVRGDGETTTVSARHDPFSEVAVLSLPEGAACVLQPRALAAVVQPIRRPLRVSRHWRLGNLNSWLTLQFRYFVFHGPARLVLKGGRGVRIEPAANGRIFGQDQMIGFSADLSYRVTRNETFWPYFTGHEPLVKDRVEGGAGILLVEEVPLRDGRPAGVRRGIEGLIDAGMKLFGM